MRNPHDVLFHEAFSSPVDAQGFLAAVLPEGLSRQIDWGTLEALPATFKGMGQADAHADLVFGVDFRSWSARLHLLVEHKSHIDRRVVLQMHRYSARLIADLSKSAAFDEELPLLVAIVVYHGSRAWQPALGLADLYALPEDLAPHLTPFLPGFRIAFENLARLSDSELEARRLTDWGHVAVDALRHAATEDDLALFFRRNRLRFARLLETGSGPERLSHLYAYLAHVRGLPRDHMGAIIRRELGPEQEEQMQSTYDQIFQEGRQEGREEGLARGHDEGLLDAVRVVLAARFGAVPDAVLERLGRVRPEELRDCVARAAQVDRCEDVLPDDVR
jgi:hypothetical protein